MHIDLSADHLLAAVPFRNVGRGLAGVATACIEAPDGAVGWAAKDLMRPNVPVGESTRALFYFRRDEAGFAESAEIVRARQHVVVPMHYLDFADQQAATTKLLLRYARNRWVVQYVTIAEHLTSELPPSAIGFPVA